MLEDSGEGPMATAHTLDLALIARNTPEPLRQRPQWVAWKYVERDGKDTKCPVNPDTGTLADSTDRSTWGTFEQAIAAYRQSGELAGVGFVFSADDPFCGVDLDHCIDPATGQLKPWGRDMVTRLASYAEISPSGGGVKIFLKALKPGSRCRKAYQDGEREIYDRDRFFTLTGRRLPEAPADVEDRQEALAAVYHEVFGEDAACPSPSFPPSPSGNGHVHLGDDEIIRLASRQRRSGEKFAALWAGRWNEHFNSRSEADSSVVFTLAFYTKDSAQIDRLFRQSGLMRAKWDEQHGEQTYGQMTIAKALAKVVKQDDPKQRRQKASRPAAPPPVNPGLPAIVIDDTQLSDLTAQAVRAILQANTPPSVFVRAGTVARVVRDENAQPRIETFDRVRMRCRLSTVANFFTLRKRENGYEQVSTNPPLSLAENVLALGHWDFPPLAGIARAPILRNDGTICTEPGYDPVSRLIYCPDPGLTLSPIPEYPSIHEVHACADILLEVISDFPFVDQPSRANALAILFSILMRPVIAGHVPLAPNQANGSR